MQKYVEEEMSHLTVTVFEKIAKVYDTRRGATVGSVDVCENRDDLFVHGLDLSYGVRNAIF